MCNCLKTMNMILNYVVATRPWSWTASVIAVLVTATLLSKANDTSFFSRGLMESLLMGVAVQSSANLFNGYFDYKSGVDTLQSVGDNFLVTRKVTTSGVLTLAVVLMALATLTIMPRMMELGWELLAVYVVGITLAICYTLRGVALKYRALGDITIFICFGPLLMECSALLIAGKMYFFLMPFTLPIGLLTEAILHANNSRDIHLDTKAGITTLASVLGFRKSQQLYLVLVVGSYVGALYVALTSPFKGAALALLSLPLAWDNLKRFQPKLMEDMDARTALLHMVFGVLFSVGIAIS